MPPKKTGLKTICSTKSSAWGRSSRCCAIPAISDILVNNRNVVYVERRGILERTTAKFRDDQHLMQVIDRIVSRVGRRVDESSPMVDAQAARRLARQRHHSAAGARRPLHVHPPLWQRPGGAGGSGEAQEHLRRNDADSGRRGQGAHQHPDLGRHRRRQDHFMNMLSSFIPETERIVTIEDAAELQLKHDDVVRLETRPPNVEGLGAVRQRQLLINSLRMRPDRIIIGEVRGDEAFDMLQAMNTGHEGSMTTIHANTSRDALSRLESMVAMASVNMPERSVRQQIASAISIVVQVSRMSDGTRKVVDISEITGLEENVISMHDIFSFVRKGIGPGWQSARLVSAQRHSSEVSRTAARGRHPAARRKSLSAPWRSN